MDLGRFLVESHLKEGRSVAELARAHGVSRGWIYKLLARHRREGWSGVEPRSRRPHRSPTRIADLYEDEIVTLRKELTDAGFDAGAQTIHFHLAKRHRHVPSVSTIWRVLSARGFVTSQPHKRPKSSYKRFVADLPNECWQADVTHVAIDGGTVLDVLNIIDDHSRLCVASRAFVTTRSVDVVRSLHVSAEKWGYPASFLSDNGAIFTASFVDGVSAMEGELLALGIKTKHSRPYHPQTCGKVERFHQTVKKFLAAQESIANKRQLQRDLDRFVAYYNEVRPHRALHRRTPLQAFEQRTKAHPTGPKIDCEGYRVRRDRVDRSGQVTLRYGGRLRHIKVGRAFTGRRVIMLVAGRDVRILGLDGEPLRRLRIDPARDYQRLP
ncbi:MAG TPA: IS481 family transposase [Acidimicrobiales bacterium]|nr:IS481 family transposase [Acidimicrobiales bacterium]